MDLCRQSCSPVRLAGRLAWQKLFNIGHYSQTFQLVCFLLFFFFNISTMLKGTIDFYHFRPHSVTFTLSGDD